MYSRVEAEPRCEGNEIGDWYWDPATYQCLGGVYYDCATGGYGYKTMEACAKECSPTPPRFFSTKSTNPSCNLPAEPGTDDCADAKPAFGYFFDVTTGYCKPFIHRGCGLNSNNFPTLEECKEQCAVGSPYQDQMKVPVQVGVFHEGRQPQAGNNENKVEASSGNGNDYQEHHVDIYSSATGSIASSSLIGLLAAAFAFNF